MPYVSTAFPAKTALKAALEAHTFDGGAYDSQPAIVWGPPTEPEDITFDNVYIVNTKMPENEYVTLGGTRIDETYNIELVVDVYRYGDDLQATEQRAWQLLNGVVSVVNADKTLAGTVNRVNRFDYEQGYAPRANLWRAQILIRIQVVGLVFV